MSEAKLGTNSPVLDNIFIEQVKMLYGNIRIAIVGTLLTALICIWLLNDSASPRVLMVWFGAHVLTALARGMMNFRFLVAVKIKDSFKPHFWAWSYASTALFSGFTWGALPWLVMDTTSLTSTLVISFAISGMIVSSVAATASFLPVFLMFSIPAGTMLGARFLVEGGMLAELSTLFFLFLGSSVFFTMSVNHIFRQSIAQRFERDGLLIDVEEKRKEAERANRDKSRFLASASHDLRQPLHALDLYLSSMGKEDDRKKKDELLSKARMSSGALGELLSTLLDISHMDAKDVQPQCGTFLLQDLFDECMNEFSPVAYEKGIGLKVRPTQGLCVKTDHLLFGRILRNFVSNAIQHSESGRVLIAARKRGGFIQVEVWDQGQGLAADKLDDIFSEFHQLNNPERDREKGMGLGLAIVRRLSLLLDHPVCVRSRLGLGSCFSMKVPIGSATDLLEQASSCAETKDVAGMFVLLIDDDKVILDAMRGWLRLRACEVLVAESRVEMLKKLEEGDYPLPDALIADYRLRDEETGLEAVTAMRGFYNKMLPAIIVSGDTSRDVTDKVGEACCQFLAKPVNETLLVRTLSTLEADTEA